MKENKKSVWKEDFRCYWPVGGQDATEAGSEPGLHGLLASLKLYESILSVLFLSPNDTNLTCQKSMDIKNYFFLFYFWKIRTRKQ